MCLLREELTENAAVMKMALKNSILSLQSLLFNSGARQVFFGGRKDSFSRNLGERTAAVPPGPGHPFLANAPV